MTPSVKSGIIVAFIRQLASCQHVPQQESFHFSKDQGQASYSAPIDCNGHTKSTTKPMARGTVIVFTPLSLTNLRDRPAGPLEIVQQIQIHQMAHISYMLIKIIHLVVASEESTRWRTLVVQLEQQRGHMTATFCILTFLVYIYSLTESHCRLRNSREWRRERTLALVSIWNRSLLLHQALH